jgi:ABC-type proline/glycine betaine transport system permease subunit
VLAGAAQLTLQILKYLWLRRSLEFELKQSARLLKAEFCPLFMARLALLVAGAALALVGAVPLGLLCCVAGEIAGRYLFFVSVVPRNMAASFFSIAKEAA